MKALIGIVFVGAIVLGIVYFKGLSNFDPTQEGKKKQAAITPGMTWSQVITTAGEPGKYKTFIKVTEKIGGEPVETTREGPPLNFSKDLVASDVKNNAMPDGFIFMYHFSDQASFSVTFDGTAKVVGVQDEKTMADLLDSRK